MVDQRYVDGLRAQIEGEERELARISAKPLTHDLFCMRQGIEMNLEFLRGELRAELGEPEPIRH
jgi:hypothetical protein